MDDSEPSWRRDAASNTHNAGDSTAPAGPEPSNDDNGDSAAVTGAATICCTGWGAIESTVIEGATVTRKVAGSSDAAETAGAAVDFTAAGASVASGADDCRAGGADGDSARAECLGAPAERVPRLRPDWSDAEDDGDDVVVAGDSVSGSCEVCAPPELDSVTPGATSVDVTDGEVDSDVPPLDGALVSVAESGAEQTPTPTPTPTQLSIHPKHRRRKDCQRSQMTTSHRTDRPTPHPERLRLSRCPTPPPAHRPARRAGHTTARRPDADPTRTTSWPTRQVWNRGPCDGVRACVADPPVKTLTFR